MLSSQSGEALLMTSGVGGLLVDFRSECEGGGGNMADGVDHIDIYADVEEEFNQVIKLALLVSCARLYTADCFYRALKLSEIFKIYLFTSARLPQR